MRPQRRSEDFRGPPPGGYYYASSGSSRAAPSPSQSYPSAAGARYLPNGHDHHMAPPPGTPRSRAGDFTPRGDETPSYHVEHLATFAVGRSFGLVNPSDGVRKLQDMERRSAIWAQPMVLRLREHNVVIEDENGELVESFPMDLVEQPTAHVSNDPREQYNNILLFIVKEDTRKQRTKTPTEMHIFQCNRVPATEVAEDLQAYIRGQFQRVRPGRRSSGTQAAPQQAYHNYQAGGGRGQQYADDVSINSEGEEFERKVNTLNRCFDDIERFVSRIQGAAMAQRELEAQARQYRTAQRRGGRGAPQPDPQGILQMRSRVPTEPEFVDIFRKFKLSFNLLADLKKHIHEPNAPELLHFLFNPLAVILQACHWGLGRNIAPQIIAPLLSQDARDLMQNSLTSKESDIWMSLGDAWRTTPEDWTGPLPQPYRPVFIDGFAPYGLPEAGGSPPIHAQYSSSTLHNQPAPLHRGESAPPVHYRGRDEPPSRGRSVDVGGVQLDLDRINFERERVEFEKMMLEKERRLLEEEKNIRAEKTRLEAERKLLTDEAERRSLASNNFNPNTNPMPSPRPPNGHVASGSDTLDGGAHSPRERAFLDDMISRRCKIVQVTYDRTSMNAKELSVHRGEYLEVLNDVKNWWECKNMHSRVGYVPHTILTVMTPDAIDRAMNGDPYGQQPPQNSAPSGYRSPTSPVQGNRGQFVVVSDAGIQTNAHLEHTSPQHKSRDEVTRGQYHVRAENGHNGHSHGHYASISPERRSPSPPTRVPEPPAPPPIAGLQEAIDKLRRAPPQRPKINIIKRVNPFSKEEEALLNQINSTISRGEGRMILAAPRPPPTVQLTENSNPDNVQKWLVEKGFSPRTLEVLSDQDGAMLFSLSRNKLVEVCGREEGSRVYSQMLVQKKRSEYQTRTGAELKAILNVRKTNVEKTNESPTGEPVQIPNGVPKIQ